MILKDLLESSTQILKAQGMERPRLDSELLISEVLQIQRVELYLSMEKLLGEKEVSLCKEYVQRRSLGEPVAYILGKKDFFNHSFEVNPHVLVPRPETELVVEEALGWFCQKNFTEQKYCKIIDFGTGSGVIGLSILKNTENTYLWGIDLSSEAILVAQRNCKSLDLTKRSEFICKAVESLRDEDTKDLFPDHSVDIIVGNPPYIAVGDQNIQKSVVKYEPSMALFSGDNGLSSITQWLRVAEKLLKPNSIGLLEIGFNQKEPLTTLIEDGFSFKSYSFSKDLSGHDRVIKVYT